MSGISLPSGLELIKPDRVGSLRRIVVSLPTPAGREDGGLALPADWSTLANHCDTARAEPGRPAIVLLHFTAPSTDVGLGYASVQAAWLSRDIDAADWLRFYCSRMDYSLRQMDRVSAHIADALVGLSIGTEVFTARITVRLFGPWAFIVLAGTRASTYGERADLLGLIVRSAKIDGRSPGGAVEAWQNVMIAGDLHCAVPGSWKANALAGPDERRGVVDFTNRDPESGDWLGQIRMRWLRLEAVESDADELAKMDVEFAQAGGLLGPAVAKIDSIENTGTFRLTAQSVHLVQLPDDIPGECWRSILGDDRYRVFTQLISPDRETQLYWWGVNRKALEIAISTLM